MILLRAAIPKTVRKPTSEPSEITSPVKYAASNPPTSAEGKVKKPSTARRRFPKDASRIRNVPIAAAIAKSSRRL